MLEQVVNVCHTTVLRDAWQRGQQVAVHGWVYTLRDGRVHDLGIDVAGSDQLAERYADALERIVLGAERKITLSDEERERTAYHESGHAVLGMLEPGADPVRKVSIVPRGRALGVTFQSPEADRYGYDERYLKGRIIGALGKPHSIVSPGVSIKPYPCGVLGHPTMDAMRRRRFPLLRDQDRQVELFQTRMARPDDDRWAEHREISKSIGHRGNRLAIERKRHRLRAIQTGTPGCGQAPTGHRDSPAARRANRCR